MKLFRASLVTFALFALAAPGAPAHAAEGFAPDSRISGPAPIPLSEQGLPSVEAAPLKTVNSERHILEGPVFDREGNLYFCDVTGGKVQRLTPENELSDYVLLEGLAPGGLAFGPDSMRVDADGNVHVAMMAQGRVLIFNPNGFPIGQILLPGRDEGANLLSTSLAIHPERKEVRIVAGNGAESASPDAVIFTAPAFAPGRMPGK